MAEERKEEGKEVARREEYIPSRAVTPFEEMDRLFESFFPRGWMRPFRMERPSFSELMAPMGGQFPRVDVVDRDEDIMVRAEMAGVNKDDIDISTTDTTVTIKGSTRHEEKEEKGEFYRCEISRGEFTRTIGLPAEVDGSKAKAAFKEGMLELTLPKVERSKRHTIKVE